MHWWPYIISGLVTGSVYGLAGTGLVLTYKTSGIFNFAHGAIGTISAYMFYELDVNHGWSWGWAAAVCVLIAGPLMGLVFELLARALAEASLAAKVASTIGVLLIVQGAVQAYYDPAQTLTVPQFLPQHSYHFAGTQITLAQIIIIVLAAVATLGLYVFFRVTRLGVAMRAVVDNSELLDVAGTSPVAVRRYAWMIGVTFASASGVLLAPVLAQLNALNLTFLVVTAFGAAAIGSFTSLPLTYAGGLLIGVAQQLSTKEFTTGVLTGLNPALPFIVLFVVLLVLPRRKLAEQSAVRSRKRVQAPWPVQAVAGLAVFGLLVYVPSSGFVGTHLTDWTNGLAYVLLFLSLGLLVRTSGQVSLAHVSFMAIGVSAMSHLTVGQHMPWAIALLLSGLIAVPIGAVLSIPAIRLSGLYLALATFGFGILLQYMFYAESYMFGASGLGLTLPRPSGFSSDKDYYYLVLGFVVVASLGMVAVNRSRLGRLLRALSDSPTGLSTAGTSVNVTRVLVFCASAFLAAVAGALQGVSVQDVGGDGYSPFQSLIFFALIIITVGAEPWYALLASFALVIIPTFSFISDHPSRENYLTILFGVSAVFYAVAAGQLERFTSSLMRSRPQKGRVAPVIAMPEQRRPAVGAGELKVDGVRVQFGGLVAVSGVSLIAPTGRITGLIGPNGAGKTTTFNACSGLNRPSAGQVTLNGKDVSRVGPSARARRGLGRTFQQMELFDSLTVRENVALGMEGGYAGLNALSHLLSTPGQKRAVTEATDEALVLSGIADLANQTVGSLSTGQRRLVELARCLAGPFQILLLDEPSSGLDQAQTERFGVILKHIVAQRGVGILLVEHDMSLVTTICDHIYVLDFGKPIFDGTAAEVMSSPMVKSAYLGGDEVEDVIEDPIELTQLTKADARRAV